MSGEMDILEIGTKTVQEVKILTEQYKANNNISNMVKNRSYFEKQKEMSQFIGELQ